jgi:glutaminyl-peptide cyclotransferase
MKPAWIDPERAFARLVEQWSLGPRFAGSPGHRAAHELLGSYLAGADWLRPQRFVETFFGEPVSCCNLWGHFVGERPGRLLLGSHFDTRPWADRDEDPARRRDPVPGANDGASGVALLAELAAALPNRRCRPSVDIVFFDAEDWHDIDGKQVSIGARHFASQLSAADRPDAVIIVDMIGGRALTLDVDLTCQQHDASSDLTLALFQLGRSLELPAFSLAKPQPYKWIGCDHSPFMEAGIPSAILIDIDYPPWHTVHDLPEHCDAGGLAEIGCLLENLLERFGEAGRGLAAEVARGSGSL